ncbi:unnamed protein product [Sphagnum troendelagicum]|uniref:Exocyst subunit Exo70 family protein n=1 Tax=Sphagnum troendelagicum TaxID=128251 RepID=A0ABP0U3D1_9BRYO
MGLFSEVEELAARAQFMRESLGKSQSITDSMITILGSFDHRLSTLETVMRPTQVRTHAYRKAHENIDSTLKAAESVLTQFDVSRQVENKVLKGPENDLGGFLVAVDQLQNNVEYFTLNSSLKASDGALNHAKGLLTKGMTRLTEEFKALLVQHSKPVEPAHLTDMLPNPTKQAASSPHGGGSADGKIDSPQVVPLVLPVLLVPRIVPQLREMAQRLVAAGYHQHCLKIYRDVRASTLEQSLRKLGVEKLSKDDVQKMQWETLEGKIGNWIQYMRISVKLLFAAERKLCDQIWYHLDPHREKCFADVTDSSVHMLLSFGEAIAKSKKSPEKLFVLLDMYETMCNLLPEIEVVFSGESALGMREAAIGLIRRLAQTAKDTFGDFEDAVGKDATKTPVLDGTVHPLTSYVINYVKFLFNYQSTLNQLLGDRQREGKPNSQLAAVTMRIMAVLQTNLDSKAKFYRDPALTHIFLMNNIHYMVRSVRRSEAKDLFGDDWVQRQRRIVQQHANTYQRAAWGKALGYLSGSAASSGGLGSSSDGSGISKSAIKERFKNFNLLFDELYQRQTQWTIPDNELREAVRLAVAEVLLPAYRSFIKRYSAILESSKSNSKYVRYSPEDLDRMLSEFFEGKARVDQRR